MHLDILLLVVSFALVCAHFLAACKKAFCVKIAIAALTYGKCKISFVFREFVIFRFRFSYLRNFSVFTFLVPSHLRDAPIRASAFFICIVPPIPATVLVSVSFLIFYYYYHPFFLSFHSSNLYFFFAFCSQSLCSHLVLSFLFCAHILHLSEFSFTVFHFVRALARCGAHKLLLILSLVYQKRRKL